MRRISLPNTDLSVSKFSLGTSRIHHLKSFSLAQKYLFSAFDCGITHLDTARMYGDGYSENIIGNSLHGLRSDLTIASKFGIPANTLLENYPVLIKPHRLLRLILRKLGLSNSSEFRDFSRQELFSSLHKSLLALKTDYLDILFIHEPYINHYAAIQFLFEDIISLKHQGKIRYLGICGHPSNCLSFLKSFPGVIDIVQSHNSLSSDSLDCFNDISPVHFTYGYLSSDSQPKSTRRSVEVLKSAAESFQGSILFSSSNLKSYSSILSSIH